MELYNDDCFNVFPYIDDKTIDLFVLDLPYGQTACKWDTCIDLEEMWTEIKRIMKPNAVILFYCTTKFGYKLIQSNEKWFRYDLIWKKSRKVGFLSANKMPLRQHENIYVFKDKGGTYNPQKIKKDKAYVDKRNKPNDTTYYREEGELYAPKPQDNGGMYHPTSIIEHENIYVFKDKGGTYNPQKTEGKPYKAFETKKGKEIGEVYGGVSKHNENKGDRHPTSIIEPKDLGMIKGGYYRGENGKPFKRMPNDPSTSHPTSIYPDTIETTILEHNNPHKSLHRTQKPVSLCEWLIKTYSNEGDTIMDFTMGSGTTGEACINTKRKFIGVEMDEEIFEAAEERLKKKVVEI